MNATNTLAAKGGVFGHAVAPQWRARTALVILFFIHAACQSALGQPSEQNAELFKQFISKPRIIRNLVFAIREEPRRAAPNAATVDSFFQARWQPNAYLLRQMPSLQDTNSLQIAPGGRFYSRFDDACCLLAPDGTFSQFSLVRGATNDLHEVLINGGLLELARALNMGIAFHEALIGKIKWNEDDTFEIETPENGGSFLRGELTRADGKPASVDLVRNRFYHRIVYSKEGLPGAPYLPKSFQYYVNVEIKPTLSHTLEILQLEFGEMLADSGAFDPAPYIGANRNKNLARTFTTDSVVIGTYAPKSPAVEAREKEAFIQAKMAEREASQRLHFYRLVGALLALLLTVAVTALIYRKWAQARKAI